MVGGLVLMVVGLSLAVYPRPLVAVFFRYQARVRMPVLPDDRRVWAARGGALILAAAGLVIALAQ